MARVPNGDADEKRRQRRLASKRADGRRQRHKHFVHEILGGALVMEESPREGAHTVVKEFIGARDGFAIAPLEG